MIQSSIACTAVTYVVVSLTYPSSWRFEIDSDTQFVSERVIHNSCEVIPDLSEPTIFHFMTLPEPGSEAPATRATYLLGLPSS